MLGSRGSGLGPLDERDGVAAEEKFGVSIPDDEVKNLKTVGDAVAFIERAQA